MFVKSAKNDGLVEKRYAEAVSERKPGAGNTGNGVCDFFAACNKAIRTVVFDNKLFVGITGNPSSLSFGIGADILQNLKVFLNCFHKKIIA